MEEEYLNDLLSYETNHEQVFKQYWSGRWVFFLGGLFWTILMPFAYAVMFKQLMKEELLNKIVVTIFMVILFLAAIFLLKNGITGLITNGKNHLVLTEDNLKIIVNSGRYKGTIHSIKYAQIKGFYFISNKTAKDKTTRKYYIKEGSSGTINLYAHNEFYCAEIYNALPAATRILSKLEKSQIDNERNELDPYGNYTPKD